VTKADPRARLDPEHRDALAAGRHAEVAAALRERGELDLAGWVLEQIWDFAGAEAAYRDAGRRVDALRMALEQGSEHRLDEALAAIEASVEPGEVDEALALLRKRRRDMEVARLLALRGDLDPSVRAEALLRAGDMVAAARLLAEQARPHEALEALLSSGPPTTPAGLALGARLCWDLGDAEGAARYAQARLRTGVPDPDTAGLLARALGSLGHDLAAQMVLERSGGSPSDEAVPGRYRITGLHTGGIVGAAYVGFDRLTLQEVEIHLLLSEHGEGGPVDPSVMRAVDRFAAAATAGANVGHPAIRPVVRVEAAAGLLVLPRAEGPPLRRMIHAPGMQATAARARALMAFLLEGLAAAHEHGIVHGWLLPSQIVTDALGRPLLPPFGAHHLAGLAATHTGALEELLAVTAPELRRGDPPTVTGDLYAAGALLAALLAGRLGPDLDELAPSPELEVARSLLAFDPAARMRIDRALEILRAPVADVRAVAAGADVDPGTSRAGTSGTLPRLAEGIEQVVADSWDEELIALLCREVNPWWQPILDRAERTLVLAPWPAGSHAVETSADDWRTLVPAGALEVSDPMLRAAIEARLHAGSLVVTPSRAIMLALDDLLAR
jgi:hypothetical protein